MGLLQLPFLKLEIAPVRNGDSFLNGVFEYLVFMDNATKDLARLPVFIDVDCRCFLEGPRKAGS